MIVSDCTGTDTETRTDTGTETDPSDEPATEPGDGSATERTPGTRYSYLIALLGRLEGPVTIDRIADAVLQWERDRIGTDGDRLWGDVHEELFRVDLPVLHRADVVEFDRTRGIVCGTERSPDARYDSAGDDGRAFSEREDT